MTPWPTSLHFLPLSTRPGHFNTKFRCFQTLNWCFKETQEMYSFIKIHAN